MKKILTSLILSVGSFAIAGTALAANTADVKYPKPSAQHQDMKGNGCPMPPKDANGKDRPQPPKDAKAKDRPMPPKDSNGCPMPPKDMNGKDHPMPPKAQ